MLFLNLLKPTEHTNTYNNYILLILFEITH